MVRRSHKHRKRFACGHRGFGQYCHRCNPYPQLSPVPLHRSDQSIQPSRRSSKSTQAKTAQRQWQKTFRADPIPLTHLPKPVVIKTRRILQALSQGTLPHQLHGKRFQFDRTLLRIPVGYRYRLLCRWHPDRIIPLAVLSHESYNAIAHHKKRLNGG